MPDTTAGRGKGKLCRRARETRSEARQNGYGRDNEKEETYANAGTRDRVQQRKRQWREYDWLGRENVDKLMTRGRATKDARSKG